MKMDITANLFSRIINAKKAGKNECIVPVSNFEIKILEIMKKEKYVSYKTEEGKFPQVKISIEKLNSCKIIKPHFYVKKNGYDKYIRRFLPSRHLGIIIVSTDKGLMTHKEAIEKGLGGSLMAFCY